MELVQEIYQVLIDREESCHRTCFSLQLDGVTLDNFAELKSIEGLQEGSVIKVVEGLWIPFGFMFDNTQRVHCLFKFTRQERYGSFGKGSD